MKFLYKTEYWFVALSALLYAAAFLFLEQCWFSILFFLIPLYVLLSFYDYKLSFLAGFMWGILTYSLQAIAILDFVYARSANIFGLLIPFVIICLMSVLSGLWFIAMNGLHKYSLLNSTVYMSVVSVVFFLTIHNVVLIILTGSSIGYPFSFPLLPLFFKSMLLKKILYLGTSNSVLFLLFLLQTAVVARYYKIVFLIVGFCLLGELYCRSFAIQEESTSLYCTVETPLVLPLQSYERTIALCDLLNMAQLKNPSARVFIFPESVFPFYDVQDHERLAYMLSDYSHSESYCILGAYRSIGEKRFNTCLSMHQGKIIHTYDKRVLVPFFEYIPSFFNDWMFSINGVDFSFGDLYQCDAWDLGCYGLAQPQLCAELFWPNKKKSGVVVGLVNDKNFRCAYFSKIMRLYADFKAAELNQHLVYSNYIKNV